MVIVEVEVRSTDCGVTIIWLPYLIQFTIESSHFIENLFGPSSLSISKMYLELGRFGKSIIVGLFFIVKGFTDFMFTVWVILVGILNF